MAIKTSRHKEAGKHSLDNDIFRGNREEIEDGQDLSSVAQDTFNYEPSSLAYDDVFSSQETLRAKKLKELMFSILQAHTGVSMDAPRRKPSKVDFNRYFAIMVKELMSERYTYCEILVELSYYFSDNLQAIFNLLDNRWKRLVLTELKKHIGDLPEESKVVNVKNLREGTEIEFVVEDTYGLNNEPQIVTGVVLRYLPDTEEFKVDSFENIYLLKIESIKKILNNQKYRYNMNKLNNTDCM